MEGTETPVQPEPRRAAPVLGMPPAGLEILPLEQIEEDATFRLRPEGDVAGLAQSLAREGQLLPVEVRLRGPGRWQLVTGFRRVAALRLLRREQVLARLHDELGDEEALSLALADDLARRELGRDELEALRARLREQGRYGPAVQEILECALGEAPPPPEPEELDLDVFSRELAGRLEAISLDLASVYEAWRDVEPTVREQIRTQLGYGRDLLPFLEEPAPQE
ncbi:MAG: ParB/RepB/Spo0J family partition protein [Myxococcales bacterium]